MVKLFAYASMINQADLSAASADVNTIAIWGVGVLVVIGAVGFIASFFK